MLAQRSARGRGRGCAPRAPHDGRVRLVHRRVIRATRAWLGAGEPIDDVAVTIEDGLIAADRHVHIELSDAREVLRGGVTAVRDLGWPASRIFPLADLSEGPAFDGPLIRAAGPILTAPGGYPTGAFWAPAGTGREVADPAEAAAAVDRLASSGAAAIKVSLPAEAGPTPDDATLLAIVDAARRHDLPVTAHAQGTGQVERALGAGITELAHTPWERLGDDVVRRAAVSLRIVSTLDIQGFGRDTAELLIALDNLRRFHDAGGTVIYGTDLGNGSIPPGIHRRELEHLRRAGLEIEEILVALTRAPIRAGAPADLVVLGADPFGSLAAFDDVRATFRGGVAVD
jgi:imidazolonepropionase-like amidohydrolase